MPRFPQGDVLKVCRESVFETNTSIGLIDKTLNEDKPWELSGDKLKDALEKQVIRIRQLAFDLQSFLPETSAKILKQFAGPKIISEEALFPRLK